MALFEERWIPNRSDNTFLVDFVTVDEAQSFDVFWATLKAILPNLTDDEITKIISVTLELCSSCHNNSKSCVCGWDE